VSENGDKNTNIAAPYSVGLLCAVLIYMSLFLYGAQVMRGVIEEKVSRIVEVIISSVKPFQLMIGKIIGVGMVGLTQFLLWILLTFTLSSVAGTAFMAKNAVGLQQMEQSQSNNEARNTTSISKSATDDESAQGFLTALQSLPVTLIVCCFLFYFLFGYMLYSALFAAVGSAVDNETETQQFMIPVTLPLIFTFMLSQSVIINNPDSSLAVWLSMIPFTSPIAMMIRLPFGVPAWQIAVSMALMIIGFLGTTWVAARIYRVGILMYGKKATYKELARWFMYKD
jgi:ABC-2 type transport system permease protein